MSPPDEIDNRNVKRIVNKINKNITIAEREATYVSITIGKRMYTVYFD